LKDYYEVLGVGPDAERSEIRVAYRREIAKARKDPVGCDAERTRLVEHAHAVLVGPITRAAYDARCVGHELIEETVAAIMKQLEPRS
jgi:DnaJ-class molecular chaperone